jgi:aspartate/glutamate racemase
LKKLVAIYTGQGLAEPLQKLIQSELPGLWLVNIIDDGIIHDVIKAGGVTNPVRRRLIKYYQIAVEIGADLILNTCSSVGEVVDLGRALIDVPIVKIDEPMAKHAAANYQRIGVVATLPTTLEPTARLVQAQAQTLGKDITIIDGLAEGAYHALINGRADEHDQLIMEVGRRLAEQVDCIVLAQASMMRMQQKLAETANVTVLSSPPLCVAHLKTMLERGI